MQKLPLVAIIAMLCAPAVAAQPMPERVVPAPYRVNGKPVPVTCLSTLGGFENDPDIDLSHCGDPSLKPHTTPAGMIGYDNPRGGYFYYQYLGQNDGLDVFYTQYSGGGSGVRMVLTGVRRVGHILHPVIEYAGGDRCNGQVRNAVLVNGHLSFSQAVTPYELIARLAPKNELQLDDLADGFHDCIGEIHMLGDDKHWIGVSLTEMNWDSQKDLAKRYRYQVCFNDLYHETVLAGRVNLDRSGALEFVRSFERRCLQSKP